MLFLDQVTNQPLEGKELWEARANYLQGLIVAYQKVLLAGEQIFAYNGQIIFQTSDQDKLKLDPIKEDLQAKIQSFVADEFFNPVNK